MTTTKHTITAELEVSFHLSGAPDDEREVAYPEIEIAYSYAPGCPARIHYDENDHPAEADELEVLAVKVIDGGGIDMEQRQWEERAQAWLHDKGYDLARENARDYLERGDG